jgi:hypothetical protein
MTKTRSLTSLFFSAMLTSSLIPASSSNPVLASPVDAAFGRAALESAIEGMRAEGFRSAAPSRDWPAAPAPARTVQIDPAAAALTEPALTEEDFLRLKGLALAEPAITNYNGKIAKLLGLTQGEALPTRQYGFEIKAVRHIFIVSANETKDVLISHKTADTITTVLTDSTRTIRAAVIYVKGTEPRLAAASEVEAIFAAELAYWSKQSAKPVVAGS